MQPSLLVRCGVDRTGIDANCPPWAETFSQHSDLDAPIGIVLRGTLLCLDGNCKRKVCNRSDVVV
jgi:hypothetical protein